MIEIGEEFCGSKSEALQDSLKQQSLNYFKTHHQSRLDELRMFLEHEAWELCPVKSNFNILQLMVSGDASTMSVCMCVYVYMFSYPACLCVCICVRAQWSSKMYK